MTLDFIVPLRLKQCYNELMHPSCLALAISIKRSMTYLPGHVLRVVYFVEILVSEEHLYDKKARESCLSINRKIGYKRCI